MPAGGSSSFAGLLAAFLPSCAQHDMAPPSLSVSPPHQVMECAHLFKSQQKAQVLAAVKGDEKYKVIRCSAAFGDF